VTMPGGIDHRDYEVYVRLLTQEGIDVTDMPRVLERGRPNRWLYAWTIRADAEDFARELRKATRKKSWRVHEFRADHLPRRRLGPIQVTVGIQGDGCAYELHPQSENLVRRKVPHAHLIPSVFIGRDRCDNSESDRTEFVWDHVVLLLTGLTKDELAEL